jgi:hypothetical protein
MKAGVKWAQEIERQVSGAYAVIPLLSPASVLSEMFAYEIEIASEAARQKGGLPHLLPVRLNYDDPLPEAMASILNPIPHARWRGVADDESLISTVLDSLHNPPIPRPTDPPMPSEPGKSPETLEPPWGAVPLKSKFYIERPTDEEFFSAIEQNAGIVLVKGARQMGKTSLLARGLRRARTEGTKVVVTDLQSLNTSHLESADVLFQTLGKMIAEQLELKVSPEEVWDPNDGANMNFSRYLRRQVLEKMEGSLIWALDEVDRLFSYNYRNDVFGLFRYWYNARELEPDDPWEKFTLVIVYATEAHLFITDPNMSPFNVGTPAELKDFTLAQVKEVNERFNKPLPLRDEEVHEFFELLGGHPYLVRRGCYEMKREGKRFEEFAAEAASEEGPYGDHLRRMLVLLARDEELCHEVRNVLRGQPCSDKESFYRLRTAGVISGESAQSARPRCRLYKTYLEHHLL